MTGMAGRLGRRNYAQGTAGIQWPLTGQVPAGTPPPLSTESLAAPLGVVQSLVGRSPWYPCRFNIFTDTRIEICPPIAPVPPPKVATWPAPAPCGAPQA